MHKLKLFHPRSVNGTISTTHLLNVPLSQTEIYESSFEWSQIYPDLIVRSCRNIHRMESGTDECL